MTNQKKLKRYKYVGPNNILSTIRPDLKGICITSPDQIKFWLKDTKQKLLNSEVTATFVVDLEHNLLINDRHTEHVVCANGEEIYSAGEITFMLLDDRIRVSRITNQSTGYCPSPDSWNSVIIALEKIGIEYPSDFTTKFIFRICENCQWINLIKDDFFVCANCEQDLVESE